jgi:hypothetical protein
MTEGKVRVDMAELNGHDYIAIEETLGTTLTEGLASARGIYAAAWRLRLRDDPTATYADTLNMRMGDFEVVNADAEGKRLAPDNGGTPQPSPESGASTRQT